MPHQTHYDLVVIGSGPGGQRAAVQAAKLKKKVLVIEKDSLGGACLHTGTIPSKTLREAALTLHHQSEDIMSFVMRQKRLVIQQEVQIIDQQLARNQVEHVQGLASFAGAHDIEIKSSVGAQKVSGDFIIIAAGTQPHLPKDIPFNDCNIFDSDSILELDKKPKSLVVLGAGVIGSEYASIFSQMGVQVTLIDRRHDLLRSIDEEVVLHLKNYFKEHNVNLLLGVQFSNIENMNNNKVRIQIQDQPQEFDALLYCMGRTGNTKYLGLDKVGIIANDRGIISVNEHYQTNIPHIYAVGDIIGSPALAASSSEQGRLAAAHAFGKTGGQFPKSFPFGIYTIPEISTVGFQESELKEKQIPFVVGRAYYKELARGKIIGDNFGFLKLLVHKDSRKILGIHVIGTGATELIHIGQVALAMDAPIDFFVNNVFNYPTLAEAYKVAAYNAYNQLS